MTTIDHTTTESSTDSSNSPEPVEQHLATSAAETAPSNSIVNAATANSAASGRRHLLRNLALGSAGAAIGVSAFSNTAAAGDSGGAAIGGNTLELGSTAANTADTPTQLTFSGLENLTDTSLLSVGTDAPSETDGNNILPGALGGYGKGIVPNGVHGSTISPVGFGVVAAHLAPAVGVDDDPQPAAPAGLAVASIGGPQVRFVQLPGAVTGPTTGLHSPGELYVDANGTLWFTVPIPLADDAAADAVPGTRFVQLAAANTVGALHTLAFPSRIADTRLGDTPKLVRSSTTEFDVTKLAGTEDPSGVPVGAQAALMNITATQTEVRGWFAASAKGVTIPNDAVFASGNWFDDNQNINANVTSALDAEGMIQVLLGPGGNTHLVVDVVGYYV